jgi:hyperosmotically inducible protein
MLCLATSSCCWVAAGAGAAGGYMVGKDKRSVGTQLDDAAIVTKIKSKLVADEDIKALKINVDCYEGQVTLKGTVKNGAQMGKAAEIARSVDGVKSVQNNLKISQ